MMRLPHHAFMMGLSKGLPLTIKTREVAVLDNEPDSSLRSE